jgi:hypothetical protein
MLLVGICNYWSRRFSKRQFAPSQGWALLLDSNVISYFEPCTLWLGWFRSKAYHRVKTNDLSWRSSWRETNEEEKRCVGGKVGVVVEIPRPKSISSNTLSMGPHHWKALMSFFMSRSQVEDLLGHCKNAPLSEPMEETWKHLSSKHCQIVLIDSSVCFWLGR